MVLLSEAGTFRALPSEDGQNQQMVPSMVPIYEDYIWDYILSSNL